MSQAAYTVTDGPAGAASIVVVPPLGMPAALMTPFTRRLAERVRVVTVELPGAGHASRAHPTTTRVQATMLADLIRASGPVPSHLFGISYGAMVSMWLAIDAPRLVDRLVLASGTARGRDAITADPGEKLALLGRAIGRGATRAALAEAVTSDATRRSVEKTAKVEHAIEATPRHDTELVWLAAAVAMHDATSELSSIRASTLVLTGADDELIPPALQLALASAIPGATHQTISSAGHAITIDQPEASARAVLAFILESPRPRSR